MNPEIYNEPIEDSRATDITLHTVNTILESIGYSDKAVKLIYAEDCSSNFNNHEYGIEFADQSRAIIYRDGDGGMELDPITVNRFFDI